MIASVVQIIVGLIVWKLVPDWIQVKGRKNKNLLKICLNIVGVLIIIFGIVSLLKSLFSLLF
jgi:uncharacterized membrane protein